MPWVRMLSANSFRPSSSKRSRGLVVDSVSNVRDTSRYSVRVVTVDSMMMAPFERLRVGRHEAETLGWFPLQGTGLATNALVREGLDEALQPQVVVPRLGKTFVLLVKLHKMHVVVAHDVTAPLLDGNVIIAPVPRVKVRPPRHA